MPNDKKRWDFVRSIPLWQYVVAGGSILASGLLATGRTWPFGTTPPALGNEPSIFEVLLNDRLMIGFIRAGIVAVVLYIIVSVPALVVARRWMKGLSTAGLTADEGDTANRSIEVLQKELEATQEDLEWTVGQYDNAQELLLQYELEQEGDAEIGDTPLDDGGEGDGNE